MSQLALGTRVLSPPTTRYPRPTTPVRARTFSSTYFSLETCQTPSPSPAGASTSPTAAVERVMAPTQASNSHKRPALRLRIRHAARVGHSDIGGDVERTEIVGPGTGEATTHILCESPAEIDASDDHAAPRPTATASTSTPQKPKRASSFTFGDRASYDPEIAARASSLAFSNRVSLNDFVPLKTKADGSVTPRSILKNREGRIMSADSSTGSLGAPAKRVTWRDQESVLTIEKRKSQWKTGQRITTRVGNMGRTLRRHSTDAAAVLRTAAGSVVRASSAIPGLAFLRQPWDYDYPPSEEDEERVRPPSPDIDWTAAGRAYTVEDLRREFPTLTLDNEDSVRAQPRGRRGRSPIMECYPSSSMSRTSSVPIRGRHSNRRGRALSESSESSEESDELHWDARRFKIPPCVLGSRFRPQGPTFEETEEEMGAVLLHDDRASSTPKPCPPSSRQTSTASDDTLPSLDASFSSLDSESPCTPCTPCATSSVELPTLDEADEPTDAIVITPRPKTWALSPFRVPDGASVVVSALTYSIITRVLGLIYGFLIPFSY
ncbi:hypothetical protein CC85DRAFT_283639 [Cutaneotrichosporon oleaginosum]|uniref:Uncharacterized protein n=1 Tax=Cutaneotrichosporon oleaginosum TaxID=879819 RepID=A0A0J0XTL1_9TREE|nr:uncharacterized protein CC85DRAFT_283639 [Cutaneotrichosporon oleaginosum]KLT44402.1 hypothetical protein CC85DRAFT_283639 [Cutaneotrichosporon oleaginosum]TXT07876.1 hypothetical protein COLE_04800 [Cutaneotrichosporon oleaginosum]